MRRCGEQGRCRGQNYSVCVCIRTMILRARVPRDRWDGTIADELRQMMDNELKMRR